MTNKSIEPALPKISVVIATFNSGRTIERCLRSIRNQDYPQQKLQLIISDGGSTDKTLKIARKYKAKIIKVPKDKQGAEYNKGYGLARATGEFFLCLDHDNILPHKTWVRKMLNPLLDNSKTVASEPIRYRYERRLSLLDRYFALFGVNDPLPYYLGKADRMDHFHTQYNLLGKSTDQGDYYSVTFDRKHPHRIPTLGANGFLIRKAFFMKSQHKPEIYFHIDINADLVRKGYVHYAFIKDDIIHLTNSEFFNFLKRRKHFMETYYIKNLSLRRYSVFYKEDLGKLLMFIVYTLTVVRPLSDSIRGWLKIRDIAWFIHPFMCLAVLYIYGLTTIKGIFNKQN